MMTDPIADMLTRLRNALLVKKREVVMPFSQLKFSIAHVLEKEGFVQSVERIHAAPQRRARTERTHDELLIRLQYTPGGDPAMTTLKRISKPGRRLYVGHKELPTVLNNLGIAVLSTSAGVMTNKEAKTKHLGGEVLCEIA